MRDNYNMDHYYGYGPDGLPVPALSDNLKQLWVI